ncbi:MAG: ThiF family adenylyltransferase [bacterium]|nr:ThiF family adenylyltransferase [bacterium]
MRQDLANLVKQLPKSFKAKIPSPDEDEGEHSLGCCISVELNILRKDGGILCGVAYLQITRLFSFKPPKVYLSRELKAQVGYIPHVDENCLVCPWEDELIDGSILQPHELIIDTVHKALEVVETGVRGENYEEFSREFVDYWRQLYSSTDIVDEGLYFALPCMQRGTLISVKAYRKDNRILSFILPSTQTPIVENIEAVWGQPLAEYPAQLIRFTPKKLPPYHFPAEEILPAVMVRNLDLIDWLDLKLNLAPEPFYLLFSQRFKGTDYLLGWRVTPPQKRLHGSMGKRNAFGLPLLKIDAVRVLARDIGLSRLEKRTEGVHRSNRIEKLAIIGLGSIGSNLLGLLRFMPIQSVTLVDKDRLKPENVPRHILGIAQCGQNKATAMADFVRSTMPHTKVEAISGCIGEFLGKNPEAFSGATACVLATGERAITKFVLSQMEQHGIKCPVVILFVEPFLLGAHCLCFSKPDLILFEKLHDKQGFYFGNTIPPEEYIQEESRYRLNEGGCQGTFAPFSGRDINAFLSKVFSRIMDCCHGQKEQLICWKWAGSPSGNRAFEASRVQQYYSEGTLERIDFEDQISGMENPN